MEHQTEQVINIAPKMDYEAVRVEMSKITAENIRRTNETRTRMAEYRLAGHNAPSIGKPSPAERSVMPLVERTHKLLSNSAGGDCLMICGQGKAAGEIIVKSNTAIFSYVGARGLKDFQKDFGARLKA